METQQVAASPGTESSMSIAPSESQLIAAVADGDHHALGELYDRFAPDAYGLALRILRDQSLAEDAVQNAFLSVWRSAATFDSNRGAARTWILTLVHRRAVDFVRQKQSIREHADAPRESLGPSAAETAELNHERRKVRTALAALPANQRTAIELAYYGGYTHQQIAARLELPIGIVKGQISNGLKRLQQLLLAPTDAPGSIARCNRGARGTLGMQTTAESV